MRHGGMGGFGGVMDTLLWAVFSAICAVCFWLCVALVRATIERRRRQAAARKWWLGKIARMCDAALQKYACEVCKKLEDPCYDRDRHILLERVRRWRIWAEHDYAEWLLNEDAEGRLARLMKERN